MYYPWKPYVPVAQRRASAQKALNARAKKGLRVDPVAIEGRKIATTYWGLRWCEAMEDQADFANRIPRGRTYVRNGSVVHLEIGRGTVTAVVSGSELYDVTVTVKTLPAARWSAIRSATGAGVSALALLQGKLDDAVMRALAAPGTGMIPTAGDLSMRCSCPDYATLCKHVAAVLYGVGARLDRDPALLFTLRGTDMNELVTSAGSAVATKRSAKAIDDDLAATFGIDLDDPAPAKPARTPKPAPAAKAAPAAPLGLHTAGQLRDLGYTPAKVKKLLAEGVLAREGFGWYRFLKPAR
ncbi:MAG: SWIM zinc finger family protein [Polyangiales bacterium]